MKELPSTLFNWADLFDQWAVRFVDVAVMDLDANRWRSRHEGSRAWLMAVWAGIWSAWCGCYAGAVVVAGFCNWKWRIRLKVSDPHKGFHTVECSGPQHHSSNPLPVTPAATVPRMQRPVPDDVLHATNTLGTFAARFAKEAHGEEDIFVLLAERQRSIG